MNLDNLNRWITLGANIGVLAGIIFLAIEINQNTAAVRSGSFQARTDQLLGITTSIPQSDELLSAITKLDFFGSFCAPDETRIEELTAEERAAFIAFLYSNWVRFENMFYQSQSGNIDEFFYEFVTLNVMHKYIPWFEMFDIYQAEFIQSTLDGAGVDFENDPRCINFQ